jgi:iduronate 2-sulfatase
VDASHEYPDRQTVDIAKGYLRTAAKDPSTPFWIGVGLTSVHQPWVFPAQMQDYLPDLEDLILARNQDIPSSRGGILEAAMPERMWDPFFGKLSLENQTKWKMGYLGAMAYSEVLIAELLDEARSLELFDNTIIILTSDNGMGLGEQNHWGKNTNWEMDTRVPLMIRVPGAEHTYGAHTRSLVELVDLYPSIAELAGNNPRNPSMHQTVTTASSFDYPHLLCAFFIA